MGDVLGIGNGIISRGRGGSKRLEVAAADPEVAPGVGAAVGECALPDGAPDGLGVLAEELGGLLDRDCAAEVVLGGGYQPLEQHFAGLRGLGGAVFGEGLVLPLGLLHERDNPRREAAGERQVGAGG